MKVNLKQYAQVPYELLDGKNKEEVKVLINDFLRVLAEDGKISEIDKIIAIFEDIWRRENGILPIEIRSSQKLDDDSLVAIKEYILEKTGARELEVSEVLDKGVLGSVSVRYSDCIWDCSLSSRIKNFREHMS